MRKLLKEKGIQPQIPRKKSAKKRRGRPVCMKAPRFQVERAFSWLQRKFRRLVVRWERLPRCFDAFLSLAICLHVDSTNSGIDSIRIPFPCISICDFSSAASPRGEKNRQRILISSRSAPHFEPLRESALSICQSFHQNSKSSTSDGLNFLKPIAGPWEDRTSGSRP